MCAQVVNPWVGAFNMYVVYAQVVCAPVVNQWVRAFNMWKRRDSDGHYTTRAHRVPDTLRVQPLSLFSHSQETKDTCKGWKLRMKLIGALVTGRLCHFFTIGSNWESGKSGEGKCLEKVPRLYFMRQGLFVLRSSCESQLLPRRHPARSSCIFHLLYSSCFAAT